jgi:hypothetical protein
MKGNIVYAFVWNIVALSLAAFGILNPVLAVVLAEASNNFSDVPSTEKVWFENNLPAKTYKSANEVMEALLSKA